MDRIVFVCVCTIIAMAVTVAATPALSTVDARCSVIRLFVRSCCTNCLCRNLPEMIVFHLCGRTKTKWKKENAYSIDDIVRLNASNAGKRMSNGRGTIVALCRISFQNNFLSFLANFASSANEEIEEKKMVSFLSRRVPFLETSYNAQQNKWTKLAACGLWNEKVESKRHCSWT